MWPKDNVNPTKKVKDIYRIPCVSVAKSNILYNEQMACLRGNKQIWVNSTSIQKQSDSFMWDCL